MVSDYQIVVMICSGLSGIALGLFCLAVKWHIEDRRAAKKWRK